MAEINNTIRVALAEMRDELNAVKGDTEQEKKEIDAFKPEDIEVSSIDEKEIPEHAKEIKTPADAKQALDEAKEDLQLVIDNLDGLCGQVEEEEKVASIKRASQTYANNLVSLEKKADQAIREAKNAVTHWSFLKKAHKPENSIKDSSLKQAAETIREVSKFQAILNSALPKQATAVPQTGAKFTGDKWPASGNPVDAEQSAWHKGEKEFGKDKSFEDMRPNPAVDHRLDDIDFKADNKNFVSATLTTAGKNATWEVIDTKSGKRLVASFNNVPAAIGPKDQRGFSIFTSKNYGMAVIDNVQKRGIHSTASELNADITAISPALLKTAASDKGALKSYYADAYGDANFAAGMVKNYQPSSANINYEPEKSSVPSEKVTAARRPAPASTDPVAIEAKARQVVKLARQYVATGAIPFTKNAIADKAAQLMSLSAAEFASKVATLKEFPIINEAALKQAHLPESESGVVGNSATGVSKPFGQVATENLNSGVKSDAKIAKAASQNVPQFRAATPKLDLTSSFTTTVNKLQAKGVDLNKVRTPIYKTF